MYSCVAKSKTNVAHWYIRYMYNKIHVCVLVENLTIVFIINDTIFVLTYSICYLMLQNLQTVYSVEM